MAGLTGSSAVERLERRGGEVWVFRTGYGAEVKFECIDREEGHAVVVGRSTPQAAERYGPRRIVLATQRDRDRLARDMDHALASANAGLERVEHRYQLEHRDAFDTDAGYAQVGCVVALLSAVVGVGLGLLGGWLTTGALALPGAIVGSIVGFVVGFMGVGPVLSIAIDRPAFRDRITDIAMIWFIVVPAVLTAVVTIAVAIAARPA